MSRRIFQNVAQVVAELPGRGSSSFTQVSPGSVPVSSVDDGNTMPGVLANEHT